MIKMIIVETFIAVYKQSTNGYYNSIYTYIVDINVFSTKNNRVWHVFSEYINDKYEKSDSIIGE